MFHHGVDEVQDVRQLVLHTTCAITTIKLLICLDDYGDIDLVQLEHSADLALFQLVFFSSGS